MCICQHAALVHSTSVEKLTVDKIVGFTSSSDLNALELPTNRSTFSIQKSNLVDTLVLDFTRYSV